MSRGRSGKSGAQEEPKDTRSPAEKEAAEELEDQLFHLRRLAQDAGAEGGTAKIFRRDAATRKDRFLESVPTSQIWDSVHEYLADNHGGGTYRLTLVDENSKFVAGAGRLLYDVEGPPKLRTPESEDNRKLDELEKRVTEIVGKGGESSSSDMVKLLVDITREQLREARNPPAGAVSANPMEMAVSLVAALQTGQAPLLAALIERASQPAPDMLAQMKGLAEMMLTLRDLSGGGESSGWGRVVDRLADPLGNLLDQHVQNQKAGVAPPATMGGAPVRSNNQPAAPPAQEGPPWLRLLGQYLPQLMHYARQGRDPEVVADFVAEELPTQYLGVIYATLTDEGFPDEFIRYVPDAEPVRDWFVAFFSRVLEWIEPPEGSSAPQARPSAQPPASNRPEVGTVADGEPGP